MIKILNLDLSKYGLKPEPGKSMEQLAREMMEACGWEDAMSTTSGDVVGLANLIGDFLHLRREAMDRQNGGNPPYAL